MQNLHGMTPRLHIRSRALGALAVAAVVLALLPVAARPAVAGGKGKPRVVVAVVDSAVNPYHEFFHVGGSPYKNGRPSSVTPQVLKEFGIDKDHIIYLTRTGDFTADFAADKAQFEAIEAGEPYWFHGTNVIGISFLPKGQRLRPDGNANAHGVGTTSAVLTANPDAIVVSVDGINDDSEKWAFTHPAVDIVTTSYGPATGIPTLNHLSYSYSGVVKNGKLHFGAATNDPSVAAFDETSGPWWSVGVAGFGEYSTEGKELASGTFPDFTADWTQELPYCRSCEKGVEEVSGTSFASPRSAGTLSRVLLEARRAGGHRGGIVTSGKGAPLMVDGKFSFTNWEIRRALEEAAYYPDIGDYQPGGPSAPIIDAAPWLETGWGVITPDPDHGVVRETLAQLGVAGKPTQTKSAEACTFMTANMEARHAYWDNFAVLGESAGRSEDPYIYC
jgi:hypothetical protein